MKHGLRGPTMLAMSIMVCDAASATRYVATRIPQQAYYNTSADAINASGTIAGNITRVVDDYGDEDDVAPFVFSADNQLTRIVVPGSTARAYGINSRGEIVGAFQMNARSRAFRFADGMATDISPPPDGEAMAMAINDGGDVAGTRGSRAFVMDAAGKVFELGQESYASAINVFGQIAGFFRTSRMGDRVVYHAFRYGDGVLEDLGALGDYAYAHGINATGDVVGQTFQADNLPRPFLYTGGAMRYLGDKHGSARAINSAGTVVGYQTDYFPTAFIYADGEMGNLNDMVDGLGGAWLFEATAINDAGQIAARACGSGECFGVRLDPLPAPAVRAVEFHHAGMDHYFITADADEIAKLDKGTPSGWARTGEGFNVQSGPQAGTAPVCRMFSAAFAPKSSHFYTASVVECAIVKRNPDWQFEGIVFYVATPDPSGACPKGTAPIYRLYNDGQGAAPNHRYLTSAALRQQMIGQGWVSEGALGIAMCAAPAE